MCVLLSEGRRLHLFRTFILDLSMALDVVSHQDLDNTQLKSPRVLKDPAEIDKQASLLGFSHTEPSSNMEEVDYESLPTDKLLPHLLAGGAAGVMEHCTMYPVDCVKVRRVVIVVSRCRDSIERLHVAHGGRSQCKVKLANLSPCACLCACIANYMTNLKFHARNTSH